MAAPSIAALRGWARRSRKTALALAITLVVVTAPFWEVVAGRRTTMYGDVSDFYVPAYVTVWRTIRAGHWPWWTQNVFAGHSMLGAGQYAVFYPFNAVFGWLDPVTAYRWWMLGHLWIAASGAFAWSWYRWRSRPGAIVSGVAYALSGFAVLHLVHAPFIAAGAWLPFVFLGADLVSERWSTSRAAVIAGALALIALLGNPQLLWMTVVGLTVYTVALVLAGARPWSAAGRVLGALACGVGIGAVQVLPLLAFSHTSVRPALTMAASFDQSIAPHHLLLLGFPYLFGGSTHGPTFASPWLDPGIQQEVGSYLGITILAIAIAGVVALRRSRVVWALVALVVAAMVIATGGTTPAGHVLYVALIGAREFRDWGRMLWLANLGVAMLAGAGVREVLRAPRRACLGLAAGALALTIAVLALPHIGALHARLATGSAGTIARWSPVVLVAGLAGAVAAAVYRRRAGVVAIILVCALDMVSFAYVAPWHGASLSPAAARTLFDASAPDFGRPYDAAGGLDRWASDWYGFRSISLAKNLLGVNGYDPLLQKQWAETAGGWLYDGYPTRPDLWSTGWTSDVLRVTTLVLQNGVIPKDASWRRAGAVPGIGFTRWTRAPRLADAYLVGAVDLAPLSRIRSRLREPYAELDAAALVERRTPAMAALTRPGPAGVVESADLLGSGKVVVNAQRDALLVLSQDWEAGWHATVDGHAVAVVRTDGLVLGVTVPRGRHVVRLKFVPPGLHLGALLAVLALLALLCSGWLFSASGGGPGWRSRRRSIPARPTRDCRRGGGGTRDR